MAWDFFCFHAYCKNTLVYKLPPFLYLYTCIINFQCISLSFSPTIQHLLCIHLSLFLFSLVFFCSDTLSPKIREPETKQRREREKAEFILLVCLNTPFHFSTVHSPRYRRFLMCIPKGIKGQY